DALVQYRLNPDEALIGSDCRGKLLETQDLAAAPMDAIERRAWRFGQGMERRPGSSVRLPFCGDNTCELDDRRMLEQRRKRQRDAVAALAKCEHAGCGERVSANRKEVVVAGHVPPE